MGVYTYAEVHSDVNRQAISDLTTSACLDAPLRRQVGVRRLPPFGGVTTLVLMTPSSQNRYSTQELSRIKENLGFIWYLFAFYAKDFSLDL